MAHTNKKVTEGEKKKMCVLTGEFPEQTELNFLIQSEICQYKINRLINKKEGNAVKEAIIILDEKSSVEKRLSLRTGLL